MKILRTIPLNKKPPTMQQTDSLVNLITNLNTGNDRLQQTYNGISNFYGYQELANIYESWLGRRIVDLVPKEALKKGFDFFCPSWEPEKLKRLEKYCDHLQLNKILLEALKSERVFGGSVIVGITDATWGAMRNPIPNFLPRNSLMVLRMFDAWQAYASTINFMNPLADDFLYPITYTLGSAGMASFKQNDNKNVFLTGAVVHRSRIERFGGEWLPWYERQRNLYWGLSVLAIAYDAIRNAGIVTDSVASLLFRASVPVFKVNDLIGIVSDEEDKQAFLSRMNLLNYQMSNNNMAIIDKEEELSNLELSSLSGLDPVLERFYVICSSATGIPVTKLVGESAKGLTATGEGDMNNYYDMLEDYQITNAKPHILSMLKHWVIPSFFDELMPSDFDIIFPEIERVTRKQKQENDSTFITLLNTAVENKLIPLKVARQELLEKEVFSNFTSEIAEEMEKESGENEVALNDALDVADSLYNKPDDVFDIDPRKDVFTVESKKDEEKKEKNEEDKEYGIYKLGLGGSGMQLIGSYKNHEEAQNRLKMLNENKSETDKENKVRYIINEK